ncbi:MAG: amino acid ABC transporter substrate-binding protein, partial [Hyphomicrobiaceae bacterium]
TSLATTYRAGHGIFKGAFENWAFQSGTRTATRTPHVVILPQGLGRTQLAPIQFVRTKQGGLKQIATLYMDIDLIQTHRIDDNDKAFTASFYLSLRSTGQVFIDDLEFTNAALDPRANGRQLTITRLSNGSPGSAYPDHMQIYKITGRFTFEPELSDYPFDSQSFAITIQPKQADRPFIVQPPPLSLRDKVVETDGWDVKSQYVGYSEDFVPLLDAFTHEASVVPFQKASFVWVMARQTTDYYLRVVVPLAFILIVAYLSYFISTKHFEAIVTIQVTALLSAVALYLSLPKIDADSATLSDRLFVFNYLVVSVMIGISILRVNSVIGRRRSARVLLGISHIILIPLMVAAVGYYVLDIAIR